MSDIIHIYVHTKHVTYTTHTTKNTSTGSSLLDKCVIYKRTSSLTNTGEDKDSSQRQEDICRSYCLSNRLEPVEVFYDEGVSGKQPVLKRNGFKPLYTFYLNRNIRIVVFEGLSRLSRDLYE